MQEQNIEKLKNQWQKDKNSWKTFAFQKNALVGITKWKKVETDLKCHQYSKYRDINKDGYIDVLTSSNIYWGTNRGFKLHDKKITKEELENWYNKLDDDLTFSDPKKLKEVLVSSGIDKSLNGKKLLFVDTNGDGKKEIHHGEFITTDNETGMIELWKIGKTIKYFPIMVKAHIFKVSFRWNCFY